MWQKEVFEALLSVRTCSWKFPRVISFDPHKSSIQQLSLLCPFYSDSAEVLSEGLCLHTVPTSEFRDIPKVC